MNVLHVFENALAAPQKRKIGSKNAASKTSKDFKDQWRTGEHGLKCGS